MTIVIVGAGETGCYVASKLSKEKLNVVLIDTDSAKLEKAAWSLDIATRVGSGVDWQLMDDLLDLSPDFLIALTNHDETNLTTCAIAKHLGYPKTIARVSDFRFLNQTRLDFSYIFDVDYFIAPELLAANDVLKFLLSPGSLNVENFAHGAIQMRTLAISKNWRRESVPLMNLDLPKDMIVGLIARESADGKAEKTIIFPHGKDFILPGDEVTFLGETEVIAELHRFFGIKQTHVESVVIIGGSMIGFNLARLLCAREIDVRIIEKDYTRCKFLAEQLPRCTVINHDGTDIEFLRKEKIHQAEVLVTCTSSDDVNFMAALLGKQEGCLEVVAVLSNMHYASLAASHGIHHAVSPRVSAADHILSHILSGNVNSLVSFYDQRAEVVEIQVSQNSKIVGIPLSELSSFLPKDFLIAVIQNRGRVIVARGDRIISPGDTVIVLTDPRHVAELEMLF